MDGQFFGYFLYRLHGCDFAANLSAIIHKCKYLDIGKTKFCDKNPKSCENE